MYMQTREGLGQHVQHIQKEQIPEEQKVLLSIVKQLERQFTGPNDPEAVGAKTGTEEPHSEEIPRSYATLYERLDT